MLNTIHGNFRSIMRFVKRNLYPCSEITKRLAYTTIGRTELGVCLSCVGPLQVGLDWQD